MVYTIILCCNTLRPIHVAVIRKSIFRKKPPLYKQNLSCFFIIIIIIIIIIIENSETINVKKFLKILIYFSKYPRYTYSCQT
jgi:hypothetical protein